MKNYLAVSAGSGRFELLENGLLMGELIFGNWSTHKASFRLPGGRELTVRKKGFWRFDLELMEGETMIASINMSWLGKINLTVLNRGLEQTYEFRQKGFWGSEYRLRSPDGQDLLTVKPQFKWKRFSYDYEILPAAFLPSGPAGDLLIMLSVYCTVYTQRISAAAA